MMTMATYGFGTVFPILPVIVFAQEAKAERWWFYFTLRGYNKFTYTYDDFECRIAKKAL